VVSGDASVETRAMDLIRRELHVTSSKIDTHTRFVDDVGADSRLSAS
jgi:acyl carrier protein